jgi:hypothetical protein
VVHFESIGDRSSPATILRFEYPFSMSIPVSGLHHVTAIASDPQRNLDLEFYVGLLGLRLVKRTITSMIPALTIFTTAIAAARREQS